MIYAIYMTITSSHELEVVYASPRNSRSGTINNTITGGGVFGNWVIDVEIQ